MRLVRSSPSLELAELRLPIVALLDVILFILMYFMFAGNLDDEEKLLRATIGGISTGATSAAPAAPPTIVEIGVIDGRESFRVRDVVAVDREALAEALHTLPRETPIILRVADDATVGAIATATQVCRDEGFEKVVHVPMRRP